MITRYEAWLNGEPLSTIHPDLAVLDIQYPQPEISNEIAKRGKGNGAVIVSRYQEKTTCTILFELHIYGTRERAEACAQVQAWAMNGGILETSDRPGQQLHCMCEIPPAITSAKNWTEGLAVTFAAYSLPRWEEKTPVIVSNTADAYVPGNGGQARVQATITDIAGDEVTVAVNDTAITLSNLESTEDISLYYDDYDYLHIVQDGSTIYQCRTPQSSDDLMAESGKINHFSVTGGSARFSVKGVWL